MTSRTLLIARGVGPLASRTRYTQRWCPPRPPSNPSQRHASSKAAVIDEADDEAQHIEIPSAPTPSGHASSPSTLPSPSSTLSSSPDPTSPTSSLHPSTPISSNATQAWVLPHSPEFDDLSRLLGNIGEARVFNDAAFQALPRKHEYAWVALRKALNHDLNIASCIHMVYLIEESIPKIDVLRSIYLLKEIFRIAAKNNLLAVLRFIGQLFRRRIRQARSEYTELDMQGLYRRFLQCLYESARPELRDEPGQREYNQPLADECRTVFCVTAIDLMRQLYELPSSSQGHVQLDPVIVGLCSKRRMFSNDLAFAVEQYAKDSGTPLPSDFWRLYALAETKSRYDPEPDQVARLEMALDTVAAGAARRQHADVNLSYVDATFDNFADRVAHYLSEEPDPEGTDSRQDEEGYYDKSTDEDFAHEQSPADARKAERHAFRRLMIRASKLRSTSAQDLLGMFNHIDPAALNSHAIATTMDALYQRHWLDAAWTVWRKAVWLEMEPGNTGRFINNVVLSLATRVCFKRDGLTAAVLLVDTYGKRTRLSPEDNARRVQLDSKNIDTLLEACTKTLSPSTAFRIWAAALPRWGVHVDRVCLNRLIRVARRTEIPEYTPRPLKDRGSLVARLARGLSAADFERDFNTFDAYDADGFAKGSASVLLDEPFFKWSRHFGLKRPWEKARDVFREVALTNWPQLECVKSPLDLDSGPLNYRNMLFGSTRDAGRSAPDDNQLSILPSPNARYMHVVLDAFAFQAYISMMGLMRRVEEIPLALAWMKELSLVPTWECMTKSLLYVSEVEGPPRLVKNWTKDGKSESVRDQDILRRWLAEWLDEEGQASVVPQESHVIARRRQMMGKGQKIMV